MDEEEFEMMLKAALGEICPQGGRYFTAATAATEVVLLLTTQQCYAREGA